MLLIITNKRDAACDYLILRLRELCIPYTRLNTEDYLEKFQIDLNLANGELSAQIIFLDGRLLCSNAIMAVYFRQPVAPKPRPEISEFEKPFARRESIEALRSLWRMIDPKLWLNHPKNLWLANNKAEQLHIAVQIGFTIPSTLISSYPASIKEFYESHNGAIIAKAVKHGFYERNSETRVALTQSLDRNFFTLIENYAHLPMIYQKRIDKECDVRVTVVGSKVFTAALHSQENDETTIDWRYWSVRHTPDLRHTVLDLPPDISTKCLEITHKYGLKYSAIDLIKARDGLYYFLEMNPNGQWAWLEEKVGFPIRDSIINCLGLK